MPAPDPARLALIAESLASLAKLESFRNPADAPPYARLDTLAALAGARKLRPVEMSILFRRAGPVPGKER